RGAGRRLGPGLHRPAGGREGSAGHAHGGPRGARGRAAIRRAHPGRRDRGQPAAGAVFLQAGHTPRRQRDLPAVRAVRALHLQRLHQFRGRQGSHAGAPRQTASGVQGPVMEESSDKRKGLLAGLLVCDFGWAVAGPVLSRFLAHHGATGIKIESNTRLDGTRLSTPFRGKPSRNNSGYFDQHNAGKLGITLDLKHPEGKRLARLLALKADLVNENFVPGVLDDLGLGYESLRRDRPDIIMISSSAQGQDGPNARAPGLGVTLQGLVGLAHLTGWPDRVPVGTGEPYTDTLVVWTAGTALMAALDYRRRTGQGMHIDLSQFEIVAHVLAPGL